MNLLSMYSGIGGFDLAASWAGFNTVAFCDSDPFCQKLLAKRFPGIPIFEEDTDVTAAALVGRGVNPEEITIIVGGYPCPGESLAGKRRGSEDDRWRWPQMFSVINEIRPRWVCCENVIGHITLGLDSVLFDLESIGYTARPVTIPACAVGAPHRRERVFIIASNTDGNPKRRQPEFLSRRSIQTQFANNGKQESVAYSNREWEQQPTGSWSKEWNGFSNGSQTLADPDRWKLPRESRTWEWQPELTDGSWWKTEPGMGRVVDGLSGRVDRLRALGNAVVPQQVYPILKAIADIEKPRLI